MITLDDVTVRDAAMLDAIKLLIEMLALKNVATHEEFARPLRQLERQARQRHDTARAEVFEALAKSCESHGQLYALLRATPAGSA